MLIPVPRYISTSRERGKLEREREKTEAHRIGGCVTPVETGKTQPAEKGNGENRVYELDNDDDDDVPTRSRPRSRDFLRNYNNILLNIGISFRCFLIKKKKKTV